MTSSKLHFFLLFPILCSAEYRVSFTLYYFLYASSYRNAFHPTSTIQSFRQNSRLSLLPLGLRISQLQEGQFCFSPFSTLSSSKAASKVTWMQLRGSAKGSTGLQEKIHLRTLTALPFSSHPFLSSMSVYKLHNALVQ